MGFNLAEFLSRGAGRPRKAARRKPAVDTAQSRRARENRRDGMARTRSRKASNHAAVFAIYDYAIREALRLPEGFRIPAGKVQEAAKEVRGFLSDTEVEYPNLPSLPNLRTIRRHLIRRGLVAPKRSR
jgi:hypothetical protein